MGRKQRQSYQWLVARARPCVGREGHPPVKAGSSRAGDSAGQQGPQNDPSLNLRVRAYPLRTAQPRYRATHRTPHPIPGCPRPPPPRSRPLGHSTTARVLGPFCGAGPNQAPPCPVNHRRWLPGRSTGREPPTGSTPWHAGGLVLSRKPAANPAPLCAQGSHRHRRHRGFGERAHPTARARRARAHRQPADRVQVAAQCSLRSTRQPAE